MKILNMKKIVILFILCIYVLPVFGQDGFQFENGVDKVKIPFKFINNLIFIPIKVNGIELQFLLDSGVEETILFSMEDQKEVSFFNVEKITLRGLGGEDSIEGLKSTNNILQINDLKSKNHLLYIVLDQSFNLSSHIGIAVNGIIGYSFFKTNLVEINYEKKRITVYKDNETNRNRIEKKFQMIPISVEKSKPYLEGNVVIDSKPISTKLLLDIGNSDAIWLFENPKKSIIIPEKNFEDYLGKGFSGDVGGRRALIKKFSFSKFDFLDPLVAFPDSISLTNVKMVQDRAGSVGSGILKRFNLVFDYSNHKLFLRKNSHFNAPFSYNKSGIEVQHYGMQWVQQTFRLETIPIIVGDAVDSRENNRSANNFKYNFVLKPIYIIASVRKNSPAELSGLQKNDVIISINGSPGHQFTLEKINSLLKSEEEKWVTFEVERDSQILKFKFKLLNTL